MAYDVTVRLDPEVELAAPMLVEDGRDGLAAFPEFARGPLELRALVFHAKIHGNPLPARPVR